MSSTARVVAGSIATLAVLSTATPALAANASDSRELRQAVTPAGVLSHEQAFQEIADANGGTRASGTPGYGASLAYVKEQLDSTGYFHTAVQEFAFDFFHEHSAAQFERISPSPRTYDPSEDFVTMEFSGAGDVTGSIVPTSDVMIPPPAQPGSSSGCEASDFPPASETEPQIALTQRGTCDFAVKADNAEAAGYDAVVIFNEGQEGRREALNGTLGESRPSIPVIGASFAVGEELYQLDREGDAVVRVFTDTSTETRETANLIADTKTGRADRTVVVGSHLDSVAEGPGINDNGSGSAADLEVALQMANLDLDPRNRVRFAFWGAEESGLIGSTHYVETLAKRELKQIAVNLNFDMVGSPNYVRFVYDGDASDTASTGSVGSGVVEDVFVDYFADRGLETEPTAFDGRSDYLAFVDAGIPAGGLFTGAEGVKTAEQAAIYGGVAGAPYDPCYHQACDTIENLSIPALDEMSDAIAHGTVTFAETTSAVEGTAKGSKANHLGDELSG